MAPVDTRRLLRESAPVALVLGFWTTLSLLAPSGVAVGLRYAGFAMALLYVAVRATAMARTISASDTPDGADRILDDNLTVAIPVGLWFLSALLLDAVYPPISRAVSVPLVRMFVEVATIAATGTGVATALLYALSVGMVRIRGSHRREVAAEATPQSDETTPKSE